MYENIRYFVRYLNSRKKTIWKVHWIIHVRNYFINIKLQKLHEQHFKHFYVKYFYINLLFVEEYILKIFTWAAWEIHVSFKQIVVTIEVGAVRIGKLNNFCSGIKPKELHNTNIIPVWKRFHFQRDLESVSMLVTRLSMRPLDIKMSLNRKRLQWTFWLMYLFVREIRSDHKQRGE